MELSGPLLFIVGVLIAVIVPVAGTLIRYGKMRLNLWIERLQKENEFLQLDSMARILENAKKELEEVIEDVVDSLDQVYTKEWKEKAADGKLTKEEIAQLNKMLLDRVMQSISSNSREFLEKSIPNFQQLILDMAEAYINKKKERESILGKA